MGVSAKRCAVFSPSTMPEVPYETRAMRRTCGVGLLAFLAGFGGLAFASTYAIVRWLAPGRPWWDVLPTSLQLFFWSAIGGGLLAAGVMSVAGRWYHWRGAYRCWRCDRPVPYGRPCVCWGEEPVWLKPRRRRFRHARRRVVPVLLGYASIVPVAWIMATYDVAGNGPFAVRLVGFHFLVTVLVAAALHLWISALEIARRGRRQRVRIEAFVAVWRTWPLLALVGLFAWWLAGGDPP